MQPHERARFEQFSDGVFAIAITLLALELHVPQLLNQDLRRSATELIPLIPNILTFILSFITIAIFWVNHHQLTKAMTHTNRRMLWANMMFLLFLTLIPFATSVVSTNTLHPLGMATYSFILFGGSVFFTILRYFVHKSCDHHKNVPMRRSIVGPLFYLLAVIASVFSTWLAAIILVFPPLFYFLPKSSIRHDN